MKRKIAACFLAGVLGMTGIPVPAAATQTVSSKNTVSSVKAADPLTAIKEQASAMDAQEQLEEEEENGNEEGFYEPSDDNDCCEEEGCHCHDDDCHCHEDGCHCHDDELK